MKSIQNIYLLPPSIWHDSSQSEIAYFDTAIVIYKKIQRLDISMNDIGRVDKIERT